MMSSINYKKNSTRIALTALTLVLSSVALWFTLRHNQSDIRLYPFEPQRDSQFIIDLMHANKYWLYEGPESGFSPERVLATRSSSSRPEHYNNLTIKTLYKKDVPIGFVAYYKLSFYIAKLLYLAVKDEYRGKGYGYILLQDAVNDMKHMGFKKVRLITRTNNQASQKLYKQFGFYQTDVEDGIVTFDYDI